MHSDKSKSDTDIYIEKIYAEIGLVVKDFVEQICTNSPLGMKKVFLKKSGLPRSSLETIYIKSSKENYNPTLKTLLRILHGLSYDIQVFPHTLRLMLIPSPDTEEGDCTLMDFCYKDSPTSLPAQIAEQHTYEVSHLDTPRGYAALEASFAEDRVKLMQEVLVSLKQLVKQIEMYCAEEER